jgi:glycosyltransferase involved in cell wall biosynthesis
VIGNGKVLVVAVNNCGLRSGLSCSKSQRSGSMLSFNSAQRIAANQEQSTGFHIVVGVTSPQTCLALRGRLRALREAGFRVSLISGPGELLQQTVQREDVEAFAIPLKRGIAPLSDLVALIRLWRLLCRLKPDIVEFSTPKAGLLGSIAAKLCGVPARVYLLRGLRLETSKAIKRRILLAAERIAASCAHVVLCNSQSLRSKALELGVASAEKLVVLGDGSSNGVDLERFSPGFSDVREQLNIPPDALVVGFVGRLTCDKGLPELVEAFGLILRAEPNAFLLLVGWFDAAEDALQVEYRRRIESHPRIICTGFVTETPDYYRAMDVMVLPTWREGFPNAVLEAAATAVPVITTYSTGSRDAVIPEVTGLLVPAGDSDAICEAVVTLLRAPDRRQCMGRAARAWISEHYEDKRVLGLTVKYYMTLMSWAIGHETLDDCGDEFVTDLSVLR